MEFKYRIPEKLKEKFALITFDIEEFRDELTLKFDKKYIVEVCDFLKNENELQFSQITDVTAIDWAKSTDRFSVVYILNSLAFKIRLKLKVDVDESDCTVDTVSGVWEGANWMERETYDMYGIKFNHHPDLRRIYMPEEFEYHPLRKEFPLTGIPGSLTLPRK